MEYDKYHALVEEMYPYVQKINLYHGTTHKSLASQYPGGEKLYYDNEIASLLKKARDESHTVLMWINSSMPEITDLTVITNSIISVLERYHEQWDSMPGMNPEDFEEAEIKIIKKEAEIFFRTYYHYQKLLEASKSAYTNMDYHLNPQQITDIYFCCYEYGIIECNYLTFCNAVFNPDTFCNINGKVKTDMQIMVNFLSKIKILGSSWKKEVCKAKKWDFNECAKRSTNIALESPEWQKELKKIVYKSY